MERISSTLIDKFHSKNILFHAFSQTVDKQKIGKKIKKLKSKKPKEGRQATVLLEPGFNPVTYPRKKKLNSKKTKMAGKRLFCQSQVSILGPVRPMNFYEF